PAPPAASLAPKWKRRWLMPALAASLLVNAAILLAAWLRPGPVHDELQDVRTSPIWAPLLNDDRTIYLVVGDYYIFGETDDRMEVKRLVREFDINSSKDLEDYVNMHPELADRYLDMELAYLPTAAAFALRDVLPVLAAANKRIRVVTTSQLNPSAIKSAD